MVGVSYTGQVVLGKNEERIRVVEVSGSNFLPIRVIFIREYFIFNLRFFDANLNLIEF